MAPGNTDSLISVPGKRSSSYDYATCLTITLFMYEVCEQFLRSLRHGSSRVVSKLYKF